MPEITMEVLCLIVVSFLAIIFIHNKKIDRTSPMFFSFSRLLIAGIIVLILEMVTSYYFSHRDTTSIGKLAVAFGTFFVSFLVSFYFGFEYVRRLINLNLPSLKKVSKWVSHLDAAILSVSFLTLVYCVVVLGANNIPSVCFVIIALCFLIHEILLLAIILLNYRYINVKRRKILLSDFVVVVLCLGMQIANYKMIMLGISVTMMIVAFYMSLEDDDVRLIEELSIEKERADAANKAKSDFIANVSHEIRTPINAVLGMDEMILRETKEEATRQYARDIKAAAQTLHGIINEILDMSKMESGKMEILPVNYDMHSLLNDTINIIQLRMNDKNLDFIVEVDPEIPTGYFGDVTRIKQVLTNILSNAVKYTKKGSVTMKLKATVKDKTKAVLHFSISDTGIGMKPEDLERLYGAYERFDNEQNRNTEGTGLGMTITMDILNLMGTKLQVTSEYGKGSVFFFDLEQDIWDNTAIGDFRKQPFGGAEAYYYEQSFEAPDTRVLVVDDNTINRKVFRGLLKNTELIIDEAESGPVCLNMVRKNKYDIIFMDHMMPDMDGIETFKNMKRLPDNLSKDAVVIMLTANAVQGAREMYMEEGFDAFIAKPIVPEKLEELIKKYI